MVSDVAILFAREDEAKARSLRAALADSGLAVALAPVETLTPPLASPVIVALWSRALASSRPAIRVAEQAIRVGRLVSGRLDVNTPNGLFHGHAMQDLSRWGGDPNDPALDGLIAAADRTVLAARAAAEVFEELDPVEDMLAAAPQAAAHEEFRAPGAPAGAHEPPAHHAPAQHAPAAAKPEAPVVRVQMAPSAPAPANDVEPVRDPAAEEALYWKSIRNSPDPMAFKGYLNRYGEDGLFAELAQERMRALAPPAEPPAPPPAPPPALETEQDAPPGVRPARFADAWRFGADWSARVPDGLYPGEFRSARRAAQRTQTAAAAAVSQQVRQPAPHVAPQPAVELPDEAPAPVTPTYAFSPPPGTQRPASSPDPQRRAGPQAGKAAPPRVDASPPQAGEPPVYRPRAEEPPAYRPRAEEPPAYRPRAEEPPAYRPHAEEPPAYRPRAEEPPAYRPRAEEPPAYRPRAEEPPAYRPRAEEPPAYRPHAEEPPAYRPRAEEPPAYRPHAEEPPAYRPRAEEPPGAVKPDVARRRARESAKLREDAASTRPPWSQPERSRDEEPRLPAPAPAPKRRRNSNLQGLIIGVAIGVVLAAAAFFLLQGGGSTPAPQPAAVQWPQSEDQAPPSEPVAGATEAPAAVEEAPIEPAPQQPRVSAPRPGDEAYRPPVVRSPPVQQGARPQSSVFSYGRPVDPATGGEGASTPAPPPSETN